MNRSRTLLALAASAFILFVAGGVEGRADDAVQCPAKPVPASLQKLYADAKSEGTVVLQTTEDSDNEITQLFGCFNRQFPGIVLKYTETLGETAPFIAAAQAGRVNVDVLQLSISAIPDLLKRDLIDDGDYVKTFKVLGLPAAAVIDDKLVYFYDSTFPLAYNKTALGTTPVPTSWNDLLKPAYKGKILVESRGFPLAAFGLVRGEQAMLDYIKALRQQDLILVRGGGLVTQQIAAGVRPIAIGLHGFQVGALQAKGVQVAEIDAKPILDSPTVSLVPKHAPHPNAGKLYAAWLSSPTGQAYFKQLTHKSILHGDFARLSLDNGAEFFRLAASAGDALSAR